MKYCILFCCLISAGITHAQMKEEYHPKKISVANDSIYLTYGADPQRQLFLVSREDRISPGTDATYNGYATLFFNNDSLRIDYDNHFPYQHNHYVNFESPKGATEFRFHFNDVAAWFPSEYRKQHTGDTRFDIPEVYELANIIWTLSPAGRAAADLNKEGKYYDEVMKHFKPFMNHPIFSKFDTAKANYFSTYFGFRENSFAYQFADLRAGSAVTTLVNSGPYYYVYGDAYADSSVFGLLRKDVEDFARQSGFRKFYKAHLNYYRTLYERERVLMPVKKMQVWLEEQFPKSRFSSYRVVFSPLIRGSHSTQKYYTQGYAEAVMFVAGPEIFENPDRTEAEKQGIASGVVFTEIDHNYVNPVSDKYYKRIDSLLSDRGRWAENKFGADNYARPIDVFNEYMTHAVFCLYIADHYDTQTASFVIYEREKLMVDRRRFIRFREFNRELLRLHALHPGMKVADLYEGMLEWCGR